MIDEAVLSNPVKESMVTIPVALLMEKKLRGKAVRLYAAINALQVRNGEDPTIPISDDELMYVTTLTRNKLKFAWLDLDQFGWVDRNKVEEGLYTYDLHTAWIKWDTEKGKYTSTDGEVVL